ncbi:MAG: acid phosphatase AphA [Pasteurellaceae bacterium]|nr:acid phosphatase AphA [Pasteurellaceae bacterium]
MKLFTTSITLLSAFVAFSSQATTPKVPYTQEGYNVRQAEQQQLPIHWVSVEQIKESLKNEPPMNVSFDIDDTLASTSACFYYGQQKYSPNSNDYLHNQAFWDELGAGCDKYSIPKESAKALIKMHQERGDQVFLITGRTAGKEDQTTAIMQKALGIKNMQPIEYTGDVPRKAKFSKTESIIKHHVKLHYGDSDDDILAAQEAGIRGIRVLRTSSSTYTPFPQAGGYGEEVLINSSY